MGDLKMGVVESRFAEIIWQHEPVTTAELIKLCADALAWKRTTTYTVLRRLCDRGIFTMENKTVTSLLSKEEFYSIQSEQFVEETFGGSLPSFIAAFTAGKKLKESEIEEIKRMIDSAKITSADGKHIT